MEIIKNYLCDLHFFAPALLDFLIKEIETFHFTKKDGYVRIKIQRKKIGSGTSFCRKSDQLKREGLSMKKLDEQYGKAIAALCVWFAALYAASVFLNAMGYVPVPMLW